MPRINRVKKARKHQGHCGSCGKELPPGSSYIWWKFRYGARHVRCTSSACSPKQSELTSSDRLSRVYAACEGIELEHTGALMAYERLQEVWELHLDKVLPASAWNREAEKVKQLLESLQGELQMQADEVRQVGEEYQESADNILEYFTSGTEQSEELESNAYECESWADEIEAAAGEVEMALGELQNEATQKAVQTASDSHKSDGAMDEAMGVLEGVLKTIFDALEEVEQVSQSMPL